MPQFKEGVVFRKMSPRLLGVLDRIDDIHTQIVNRLAIVTSARDGKHMKGSLHYVGKALDLRTRDLSPAQIRDLFASLAKALGPDFDVVLEPDHLHVELDEKMPPA